jgi:hypothetical protein
MALFTSNCRWASSPSPAKEIVAFCCISVFRQKLNELNIAVAIPPADAAKAPCSYLDT